MKIPESWNGVRVGVLGLGRSGRSATRLLVGAGASVYASDVADDAELRSPADELRALGADVDLGRHDAEKLASCEIIVASPGIPASASVFQEPAVVARPIISELELAFAFLEAPIIAVTGTNGKTTTTAWIGDMLARAGVSVGVGGNIGMPLSDIAMSSTGWDCVAAEVSSYQLTNIVNFAPSIGVLLNLSADHLDRYESVERYFADKARLFDNARDDSCWVLNGEDQEVLKLAGGRPGRRRTFRVESEPAGAEEGAWLTDDGVLRMRCDGDEVELGHAESMRTLGRHNVANALAASLAACYANASFDAVRESLREFEAPAHRFQPVAEIDGVLWINDSKATNVGSARVALGAVDRPLVVLLGGVAKGQSFSSLAPELARRARTVIAYGSAAEQIEKEIGEAVSIERVDAGFEEVVARAARLARPGDAVLLAPACASQDMFHDYEERGSRFVALVNGMKR